MSFTVFNNQEYPDIFLLLIPESDRRMDPALRYMDEHELYKIKVCGGISYKAYNNDVLLLVCEITKDEKIDIEKVIGEFGEVTEEVIEDLGDVEEIIGEPILVV